MAIGGFGSGTASLESVETLDLLGACTSRQTPMPRDNEYNFGVVDAEGNPMSCGGINIYNSSREELHRA